MAIPIEEARQRLRGPKLVPFKDIRLSTSPAYLVKGLVPAEGLTVVWGPPKSGKSFLIFDIAMSVARECKWRGRRVQGGPVVYVAAEGATGFRARVEAFRQRHLNSDQEDPPFYLVSDVLGLPADKDDLVGAIRAALGDQSPALVVLDTLNRTLVGSENAPEDMTAYVRVCDAIRDTFGCGVLVVHHCGIDGNRPRGHTSLTGAADCQIAVKRTAGDLVCATVECMKDGPEGEAIYSRLQPVDVGQDDDGDIITTCMVIEADAPKKAASGEKLTKNQETMRGILHDAKPNGLTVEEWNAAARDAGLGVKRKADLHDLRSALKQKNLVYEHAGKWFVK